MAQAAMHGDERVAGRDYERVLLQVFLLIQVGAVGDYGAHAQRQREEHLACRRLQHVYEASEGAEGLEVGGEHELVALAGARLEGDVDDDEEEHEEERRHCDRAELLYAALDAAHDYHHVADDEEDVEENHAAVVVEYVAEEAHTRSGEAVDAQNLKQEAEHVAHDEAAEDVVEREQRERRQYAEVADPLILLAERGVGADRALAGLAAYRQLAEHDDDADEDDEQQVDDEEGEAALVAHLVREAPDVAEADCGADGGHQEAEVGAPCTAIVFHVLEVLVIRHIFPSQRIIFRQRSHDLPVLPIPGKHPRSLCGCCPALTL